MADLVSAVATSHVLMSSVGAEAPARRVFEGMLAIGRHVRESHPDVLVVVSSDHMFNVRPGMTAPFYVGCAERYVPFGDMDIPRDEYRGQPGFARGLVDYGRLRGVAVDALESLRPDHGTAIPLLFANPDRDVAVVPLLVNYDLAETPSPADCARVGNVLREFIASRPSGERVAIVAAGGLSHWVGYENPRINEDFDRRFLAAMRAGEHGEWCHLSAAGIRHDAGNGGLEVMSWLLMAATVPDARAEVVYYEPMPTWMTGMGGVVMRWGNSMTHKHSLILSVGVASVLAALAVPAPAIAQSSDATQSSVLEEIVVTARKREENLQETPISITAMSGEALEARQISTTQGLEQIAPNLIVSQGQSVSGNSSAGAYFIRGIGQIDFLLNTDPGVGLYVDGIYISRSIGSIMDLVDLERIEVLRGPQGTLFGRNTIGGAISLVSKPPSDTPSADVRVTIGSYERYEARLTLDGPLTETVSGKIAGFWRERDGWVDRITDGSRLGDERSVAARGALRWEPTDDLLFDLAVDYVDQDGTSPPANVVQVVETAAFPGFHNGALVGPPCVPSPGSLTDPRCFNSQWEAGDLTREQGTFDSKQELEVFGASLTGEWEIVPNLTLRSITGYRETDALGNRDGDHTPILIQTTTDIWTHEQFSEELQLLGVAFDERLNWVLGAYYSTEEGENVALVEFPFITFQSGGSVDNENAALFGQATYAFTDRLSLTAGLRYTDETKTFLPDQFVKTDPLGLFPPGSVPGFRLVPHVESEQSISETTPMANLAYQWTDGLMTYASYSEGFKSGGFTQRIFPPLPAPPPFGPEFAKSYEVGFKFDSADKRLRLNGAAYYTDYTDLQVLVLVGVQPLTANAGDAEIRGFELELQAVPVENLQLSAGVGYTDAGYTSLDPTVLATGVGLDSKFAQVPEWTGNFDVSYTFDLGPGQLTPRAGLSYRSETYMNAVNTPSLRQGDYTLVNASIEYVTENGHWQFTLFGQNLSDEEYINGGFADLQDQGYAEVAVGRPREYGVTVAYRY